jgi:hypothetical protein
MRYAASDREWIKMYGVQCWVIPGRAIETATIGTAGTLSHALANGGGLCEAEREERIYDYLATHKPASAYTVALCTSQGFRVVYDVLTRNPKRFQMVSAGSGALESGIWGIAQEAPG